MANKRGRYRHGRGADSQSTRGAKARHQRTILESQRREQPKGDLEELARKDLKDLGIPEKGITLSLARARIQLLALVDRAYASEESDGRTLGAASQAANKAQGVLDQLLRIGEALKDRQRGQAQGAKPAEARTPGREPAKDEWG